MARYGNTLRCPSIPCTMACNWFLDEVIQKSCIARSFISDYISIQCACRFIFSLLHSTGIYSVRECKPSENQWVNTLQTVRTAINLSKRNKHGNMKECGIKIMCTVLIFNINISSIKMCDKKHCKWNNNCDCYISIALFPCFTIQFKKGHQSQSVGAALLLCLWSADEDTLASKDTGTLCTPPLNLLLALQLAYWELSYHRPSSCLCGYSHTARTDMHAESNTAPNTMSPRTELKRRHRHDCRPRSNVDCFIMKHMCRRQTPNWY